MTHLSLRNPIAILMASIAVVVFAVVVTGRMAVDTFPELTPPVTATWTTGAFEGSYWRTNGGRTPSDFGTALIAKATCCWTSVCAALRSVPHLSQT